MRSRALRHTLSRRHARIVSGAKSARVTFIALTFANDIKMNEPFSFSSVLNVDDARTQGHRNIGDAHEQRAQLWGRQNV
jgi:hypothetical protein